MRFSLSLRKIVFTLCCILNIYLASLMMKTFERGNYMILATIGIIAMNVLLIVLYFFNIKKWLLSFLILGELALIYYVKNGSETYVYLILSYLVSWIVFVSVKSIMRVLLIPLNIVPGRRKSGNGILAGKKWICTCQRPSGKICGETIITFKNHTPNPVAEKGCPWSSSGRHNFVPSGSGTNFNEALGNAACWLGFFVGIIGAVIGLVL